MTTKVVIFTSGYDTGGQGWRLKRGFDRHQPEFSVRSIHSSETYFEFPFDLRYRPNEAYRLFDQANVLHMRNTLAGIRRLRRRAVDSPFGLVLHHHGTKFRTEHATIYPYAQAVGAIQVASTLDLTLLEPQVEWLPSPFDIEELMALRLEALHSLPEQRPFRIAHAPTNREVKSTAVVMEAVLELNRRGIPTVLDLIERMPYAKCLARKAKADVYFDQLHLGYGNNAVEAWGMVMPVVAGVADPAVKATMEWRWGSLPFVDANEATLADRLAELATDLGLRSQWAAAGYKHALKYHEEGAVVERLAGIYRQAMSSPVTIKSIMAERAA